MSAQAKSRSQFDAAPLAGCACALGPQFDAKRDMARAAEIDLLSSSADERSWSPDDPSVLNLARPFDVQHRAVMPEEWYPELRSAATRELGSKDRVRLGNEIIRWFLSGILHGEQAAFYLSAQLCTRLEDAAAREFMANQAREEARHARAFSAYIVKRWGAPYPAGSAFANLLDELHGTDLVDRKIVGMCVLIEGFAMGAISNIRSHTLDPALAGMLGHVLRDETVHHNFGAIWLEAARRSRAENEWRALHRFARRGYRALSLNLVSIHQRRAVYPLVGLDWRQVRDAVRAGRARRDRAPGLEEDINPLTVLARNLERAKLMPVVHRGRRGASVARVQPVEV